MSMIAPALLMLFVNHIVNMLWTSEDILSNVLRQTCRMVHYLNEHSCGASFDQGVPFMNFARTNGLLEQSPHLPEPWTIRGQS